jgi:hypothetical protein
MCIVIFMDWLIEAHLWDENFEVHLSSSWVHVEQTLLVGFV